MPNLLELCAETQAVVKETGNKLNALYKLRKEKGIIDSAGTGRADLGDIEAILKQLNKTGAALENVIALAQKQQLQQQQSVSLRAGGGSSDRRESD